MGFEHYTKLNFQAEWVSTDPLLMEGSEHLPDNADKNAFVSWCQAWILFQHSPPDNALNFCVDLFSYKWSFPPTPNTPVTIRRHLCSIHSLPFGLISSLSFNLALLFFISRRPISLNVAHCLSCQGMSHLAPFHYTFTVSCQRRKCKTCMKHTKGNKLEYFWLDIFL